MINLSEDNFTTTIKNGITLVDFNADWCGPCQMQAPILEELDSTATDLTIASLNIDDEPDLAEEYSVSSIPCLVFFKDGKEVERLVGLQPKKKLLKVLEKIA